MNTSGHIVWVLTTNQTTMVYGVYEREAMALNALSGIQRELIRDGFDVQQMQTRMHAADVVRSFVAIHRRSKRTLSYHLTRQVIQ